MDVAVGSTNPVKIDAVERTLERFEPTVTAVDVESGVPEQPWSVEETVAGAENRARRALAEASADYEFGVGLEGGVTRFDGAPGVTLIMWAAVTDGERVERGGGPSLRLPDRVAERLEAGEELGPVMDDELDTTGIAESDGAIGVCTDGLTDRTTALGQALACAFGPFRTTQYE
ncbi:inosine/xanthosine triphosphatase [Halopiger aswanensis]|uniref:Probable inosine/xanthosine triphosphatase n=1 Tax=Halopiger aswanensis TaxID=148449 RepID=A0A3R7DD95_9EURY|nr:inosine/xanthosine triphosphatase [Halopiger aswanensis]RKD95302.1 inosine/xanthosine triphosphatase [Halopiger aswanensis]